MSVGKHREEYGGSDENKLLAVNPRREVLADGSAVIIDSAIDYNGTVYRADNTERIENVADFYRSEEALLRDLEEESEVSTGDPKWYDRAFLFDDDGFDASDVKYILEDSDSTELAGGPLEDIGKVVDSLGRKQDYSLNPALTFDYGALNAEQGYVESEMNNMREIMSKSPESVDERLARAGLDDVALDI